jgi:hypothetical protein
MDVCGKADPPDVQVDARRTVKCYLYADGVKAQSSNPEHKETA